MLKTFSYHLYHGSKIFAAFSIAAAVMFGVGWNLPAFAEKLPYVLGTSSTIITTPDNNSEANTPAPQRKQDNELPTEFDYEPKEIKYGVPSIASYDAVPKKPFWRHLENFYPRF